MAINLTIQFTQPTRNPDQARAYEQRTAEWLQRIIADNCAFQVPDIHIDFFDEPWNTAPSSPAELKSQAGAPSS